jgi:hypothetical protein
VVYCSSGGLEAVAAGGGHKMDDKTKAEVGDVIIRDSHDDLIKEVLHILNDISRDGDKGIRPEIPLRLLSGLREFNRIFNEGVSDPDHFMSLSNMETLGLWLIEDYKSVCRELLLQKAMGIDEDGLVEKKKSEYLEKGVRLRKWRRFPREIMTLLGPITYLRMALIPSSPEDRRRLLELTGKKMVFPLDETLGIDRLPFKISVEGMLEIAHWIQEIPSYKAATRAINRNTAIQVKEDTVRAVANHVGSLVFEAEKARSDKIWGESQSGRMSFPAKKKDYDFYLEVDGAMIHTRRMPGEAIPSETEAEGDEGGEEAKSVWMENKLGMVFNSTDFRTWVDVRGERKFSIGVREYIPLIGPVIEFKKLFFAMAIRNNYGHYANTILISDGSTWIKNMKHEIFPDAHHILGLFHLCEKVSRFSKELYNNVGELYKPWSAEICTLLKESKSMEVLKIISKLGKKLLSRTTTNLVRYIESNKDSIDYVSYRERGWYVGSGAIESANKTVLQFRLKQPGMRWSQDNGQYIVSLMARAKSGLWERDVRKVIQDKYEIIGMGGLAEGLIRLSR